LIALERSDAPGLKALEPLLGLEVHLLSLDQLPVARAFDGREVGKDIGAAVVRGDEPESLGGVESLHGTCCHGVASFLHAGTLAGDLVAPATTHSLREI
jgi:hypothetical protein